ncbi:MAG: type II toxin-antitoxin system RelE/ParE family toxin [Lachnospiraceae bacterium]|nr:type II toxin-antitoxin system RelE/ParE family toxin [Lachnospiraceae bacterium]
MSYEVRMSNQANYDIKSIYEYIAFELLSPENAVGQVIRLEESILNLDTLPERFKEYDKEPWKSRGLRIMPVDNYLVFYIPDKEKRQVVVIRVMYAGRNVDIELNKNA